MIFNKIYEKLDQSLKDIESLKKINSSSKEQFFESLGSLQVQFHDLRTHVEIMHEKINDLTVMLSSKRKSS